MTRKGGHSEFSDISRGGADGSGDHRSAGIRRGLAETLRVAPKDAGATTLPTDRRLCVVRQRARPASLNRNGDRECDRARLGKTRPCPFESGSAVCCREVFGQVTKGFFDSLSCGVVTILEVFERLRCETDLPHCSSQNAALKE